jgi:hypothetical protein
MIMAVVEIGDRIQRMEERLRQLKAQQTKTDARRRILESRKNRKEDTWRKILVGAIVLAKVEQGVLAESLLREWLQGALVRDDDRALFQL